MLCEMTIVCYSRNVTDESCTKTEYLNNDDEADREEIVCTNSESVNLEYERLIMIAWRFLHPMKRLDLITDFRRIVLCDKSNLVKLKHTTKLETHLSNERQHMARNIPLREACSCVGEKVHPLPLECLVRVLVTQSRIVLLHHLLSQILLQPPSPLSECSRVVSCVILHSLKVKVGGGRLDQGRCRWKT